MTSTSKDRGGRTLLPLRWRIGSYVFVWVLLLIIVLQNMEPTHLDILFWSFGEVPKLVVVLGSMVLGIGLWETGRFLRSRPSDRSDRERPRA